MSNGIDKILLTIKIHYQKFIKLQVLCHCVLSWEHHTKTKDNRIATCRPFII